MADEADIATKAVATEAVREFVHWWWKESVLRFGQFKIRLGA
jgi:hypothetical protein